MGRPEVVGHAGNEDADSGYGNIVVKLVEGAERLRLRFAIDMRREQAGDSYVSLKLLLYLYKSDS